MRSAAFKYTFPIAKAERRADGLFITGEATGPEVDGDGERISVDAIASFSRQIELAAEIGEPIPYRDSHQKGGVLHDLGVITKAWITPDFHLGIEVRLDEDNPAALSLFKQINKGKQFGMSVAGHVLDFADEYVAEVGKMVRTFKDVVLEEISNTTRPAWYPSFGTVLSKAIKDAEDSESDAAAGENVDNDELQTEQETTETPAVTENDEAEVEETEVAAPDATQVPAPEAANDVVGTEAAEQIAGQDTEATQVSPPDVTNDVNNNVAAAGGNALRAPRADGPEGPAMNEPTPDVLTDQNPHVEKAVAAFRELFTALLRDAANGSISKSVSQDDESTLAKALDDATAPLKAEVEDLRKSLGEATARIEELENSPAGDDAPPAMEKHMTQDEVQKALAEMDPRERMRLGLRGALGR